MAPVQYGIDIYKLRQLLNSKPFTTLRSVHQESARLNHAIKCKGEWQSYLPTHFIYAFFTFNTLYNIDWNKSLELGRAWNTGRDISEKDKIKQYFNFCCQDENFLLDYGKFFVEFVLRHYNINEMLEVFYKIKSDNDIKIGGSLSDEEIANFHTAFHRFFKDGVVDEDGLNDIVLLIYRVRCNLFHGVKTLEDLNRIDHQKKLDIYSVFIIAINQMVFSYLNYLDGRELDMEEVDDLIQILKWKPGQH